MAPSENVIRAWQDGLETHRTRTADAILRAQRARLVLLALVKEL